MTRDEQRAEFTRRIRHMLQKHEREVIARRALEQLRRFDATHPSPARAARILELEAQLEQAGQFLDETIRELAEILLPQDTEHLSQ